MTTPQISLHDATNEMMRLIGNVDGSELDSATPCEDWTVADLIEHVLGSAGAFTAAANRENFTGAPSRSDRENADVILKTLAAAWDQDGAQEGTTIAGGNEMPAQIWAAVALDELVIHGWDLAKATGQSFNVTELDTVLCLEFTNEMAKPGQEAGREGMWGPVVSADGGDAFARVLGNTGRSTTWSA